MNHFPQVLHEAVRLWPDLARVKDALDTDTRGTVERAFSEERVPDHRERIVGVRTGLDLDAGRSALEKIEKDGVEAILDQDEVTALERMFNFAVRPAILVRNGTFLDTPPPWDHLVGYREQIEGQLTKVGRLQAAGHPLPFLGTAFVVGEGMVMTNRHVAEAFARSDGKTWMFKSGMTASVSYADDPDHGAAPEFAVERVVAVHPLFDLAVLQLASGEEEPPSPMILASAPPEPLAKRQVYSLGYPAAEPGSPPGMDEVFSHIYNVKRLQPGEILNVAPKQCLFRHDCSTLAGNSGSCVVDLETNLVLGVHFDGKYLQYNQAVALWYLEGEFLLREAGATFV